MKFIKRFKNFGENLNNNEQLTIEIRSMLKCKTPNDNFTFHLKDWYFA